MASRSMALGLFLLLPFLSTAQTPLAPTYEALTNAAATGGSFRFSGPGTISVPTPVSFGSATTLDAEGHAVILSGGGESSILRLQTNTTLRMIGLWLVDGAARGSEEAGAVKPGQGGAIVNLGGELTLKNCVLSNNLASGATNRIGVPDFNGFPIAGPQQVGQPAADATGGAIWQIGGRLTIENCTFSTNRAESSMISYAPAEGGAIYIKNAAGLEISGTTFLNNSAVCGGTWQQAQENSPSKGGAIYVEATPARIDGGEISHNSAHGASGLSYGGAIYQAGAMLTISNAIVSHNGSFGGNVPSRGIYVGRAAFGGAIFSDSSLVLASSAVLSNVCLSGIGGTFSGLSPAYGGAISSAGNIQIVNSTFSGNRSYSRYVVTSEVSLVPSEGGALYSSGGAGITNCTIVGHSSPLASGTTNTITVKNTLFADNEYDSQEKPISDAGHNLSSDAEPQFTQSTSRNGVETRLGPIGLYGGPTPVYPLMAGSPAINAADDSAAPPADQRGRTRPFGAHADIGSFESSSPFYVWGKIQGYIDPPTTITIGGTTNLIDTDGNYFIGPLKSGVYMATLSAPNPRFRPNPWLVPSDADRELSDVKSFELHTIDFDHQLNDPAFVLAGNPGEVWDVELSPNFSNWTEYGPFTIPSTGLTNVPAPVNAPFMFMRGSYTTPAP